MRLLAIVALWALVACGGSGGDGYPVPGARTPAPYTVSVSVTGGGAVARGLAVQLYATAVDSVSGASDVTSQAGWTSSDPAAVGVAGGLATAVGAPGSSATLTATYGGRSGQVTITVGPVATVPLALAGGGAGLPVDRTMQLRAVAIDSTGAQLDVTGLASCAWSTSAPAVLAAAGLVSPSGAVGDLATVTATYDGRSDSRVVTLVAPGAAPIVSVAVGPTPLLLAPSTQAQLTAVATNSVGDPLDVTSLATWTSSAPAVVAVDSTGRASAGAAGGQYATVRASYAGLTGSRPLLVLTGGIAAVALSAPSRFLPLDRTLRVGVTAVAEGGTALDVTALATITSTYPSVLEVAGNELRPRGTAGQTATVAAHFGGRSAAALISLAAPHRAVGPGHDDDPLLAGQWHLRNLGAGSAGSARNGYAYYGGVAGADLHADATWLRGYGGAGVKVGVVDTGLEIAHEDLAGNVVPGSWNFDPLAPDSADPTNPDPSGDHGTAVAGLIAAVANNGKGGMGVAPQAGLNGYNFLLSSQDADALNKSLGGGTGAGQPRSRDVWVFNQSFGTAADVPYLLPSTVETVYWDGVRRLRGGLGAIYAKAAGNGFDGFGTAGCTSGAGACCNAQTWGVTCQNASMDPANTIPPNLVVAAVNASGVRSSYSTAGSAIWVAGSAASSATTTRSAPRTRGTSRPARRRWSPPTSRGAARATRSRAPPTTPSTPARWPATPPATTPTR